jgi:hypothetical protein
MDGGISGMSARPARDPPPSPSLEILHRRHRSRPSAAAVALPTHRPSNRLRKKAESFDGVIGLVGLDGHVGLTDARSRTRKRKANWFGWAGRFIWVPGCRMGLYT